MCDGQIYFVLTFVVVHHELKQHVKLADLFLFVVVQHGVSFSLTLPYF